MVFAMSRSLKVHDHIRQERTISMHAKSASSLSNRMVHVSDAYCARTIRSSTHDRGKPGGVNNLVWFFESLTLLTYVPG